MQLEGKTHSLALQGLVRQNKQEYESMKKKVKDGIKKDAEKAINKLLDNAEGQGIKWNCEANRLSITLG